MVVLVSLSNTQTWCSDLQAHVLLHFINASHARRLKQKQRQANPDRSDYGSLYSRNMDFLAHIAESCKIVSSSYGTFKKKAREQVKTPCLYDKCTSFPHMCELVQTVTTNHIFVSVSGLDNVRITAQPWKGSIVWGKTTMSLLSFCLIYPGDDTILSLSVVGLTLLTRPDAQLLGAELTYVGAQQ